MPFRLVKGDIALFRQTASGRSGSEPDGDGVWFKPRNPNLLRNFEGRTSKFNAGGFINLRLEGIDALEIHYQGEHQQMAPAKAARDRLLRALGFTSVSYGSTGARVTDSTPAGVQAHILTRGLDGTSNHRPISFLFPGGHQAADGSEIFLQPGVAARSLNARLLRLGLVYPLYYDTLPPDIRDRFTAIVIEAFNNGLGIWDGIDTSNQANTIRGLADLRDLAIWPKLFRRLADFFARRPNGTLEQFDTALRTGALDTLKDDELTIVAEGHTEANANLHDIYDVLSPTQLRMKFFPEEIIVRGD